MNTQEWITIPIIYDYEIFNNLELNEGIGVIYVYDFDGKKYVGQSRNPYKRHYDHFVDKCPVSGHIRKYGKFPQIIWMGPLCEMNNAEMFYIKKFNSMHPNGWNFTSGGDSPLEKSAETCAKLSEAMKKRADAGLFTANKYRTAETFKKIARAHYKRIAQYDMDTGKLIATYECMRDAARMIGKESAVSNISACAKGKRPYAHGYVWRYVDDEPENVIDVEYVKEYKLQKHENIARPIRARPPRQNFHHSEETKKKMSEMRKGKPSNRKGMPSPLKGTHLDPEVAKARYAKAIANHPDMHKKRAEKTSGKNNYRAREVVQMDDEGNEIARYDTAIAAGKALGIYQSAISACCTGKRKHAGGYRWKFA